MTRFNKLDQGHSQECVLWSEGGSYFFSFQGELSSEQVLMGGL